MNSFYLNKIACVPYLEWDYDLPTKVLYNYIRIYRKKLDLDDVIDFMLTDIEEPKYYSNNNKLSPSEKVEILSNVFEGDFNYNFSKQEIENLHEKLKLPMKDFVNFVNFLSENDPFVGSDLEEIIRKWNSQVSDLFECRSWKIESVLDI